MSFQFTAQPVLFKLGGFTVYSWGLLNAIAVLVAFIFIYKNAKKHFSEKVIFEILASIIVFGMIFARLAYVLINLQDFSNIWDAFLISKGGMEGFGALIGGIFGAWIYSKFMKIDAWKFLDISAPWLALAYAIGRIGCFVRGCCFGMPTELPWGVVYNSGSLALNYVSGAIHPTQLYHSIADFVIFLILFSIVRRKDRKILKLKEKSGVIFLLFVILYSAERILIDFVRWKSAADMTVLGISVQQIAYLLIFAAAMVIIMRNRKKP